MNAELVRQHNLVPVDQPGDGNCLFHSLAYFFREYNLSHLDMRRRLCEYMLANRSTFEVASVDSGENFDVYVAKMMRTGTLGDGTIIQAFSSLFNVNVCIFADDQIHQTLPNAELKIGILWDRQHSHYQALTPLC